MTAGPAGAALAGLGRLIGQLDHLGRLNLQPAPVDPLLGLCHDCLHLGLPERRELVQLAYLPAGHFGRLLVPTVHRISELEQEPGPQEPHSLQLSPQGQQPAGRAAACRQGARGDAGPRAKAVQRLGRGAGDGAVRLAPRGLEEDEHEQDADAERR